MPFVSKLVGLSCKPASLTAPAVSHFAVAAAVDVVVPVAVVGAVAVADAVVEVAIVVIVATVLLSLLLLLLPLLVLLLLACQLACNRCGKHTDTGSYSIVCCNCHSTTAAAAWQCIALARPSL